MKIFFWFCLSLIIPGLLIRIPFGGAGILLTDIFLPLFAFFYLCKKIFFREKFPQNTFFFPGIFLVFILFLSWLFGSLGLEFKEKILSFSYIIRIFSMLIVGLFAVEITRQKDLEKAGQKTSQNIQKNQASKTRFAKIRNFQKTSSKDLISRFRKYSCQKSETESVMSPLTKIFGIIFLVILLAFLQFFFFPNLASFSTFGGWDPHVGRLLGTWMDPNYLGGFLAFMIPLSVAQAEKKSWSKAKKQKIVFIILSLFFILALFLTFSRSAYLAFAFGIIFFYSLQNPKVLGITILLGFILISSNPRAQKRVGELAGTIKSIVFFDTDEIDPTASLRIENWGKSFELFKKYPLLGVGYNTYRFRAAEEGVVDESFFSAGGADSTPLTVLVTSGIVGFFAFFIFLASLFLTNLYRYFQTKNPLFLGFCAGFLAINVHALFVNSFFFPFIFLYVMVFVGIMDGIYGLSKNDR